MKRLIIRDLLRAAAQIVPDAKGGLAPFEFTGCEYSPAIAVAEHGSIEGILDIGPQLQAGQINLDEVALDS